jgi:tRNA-2-methylthio-N6-dimethylallyladenosine synthase
MAYIAIYSPRPGAVSSKWQDTVPHAIKKERLHVLTSDLEKTSRYHTNAMLGKTYRILVTGRGRKNKYMTGLTEGRINVRFLSDDFSLIGKFTDLKITGATDFSVEGELVNVLETNQYE